METMLVRLKPYDPRRGHVLRRFGYCGIKFREERGWYHVDKEIAEYLRGVRQVFGDKYSPFAFDVCTEAEAKALDAEHLVDTNAAALPPHQDAVVPPSKLDEQIDFRRSSIRTDRLEMTYGKLVYMYEDSELVVAPAYRRRFWWNSNQKSRFIESILLGIPTPSLFVAETEDGIWELVDGLQRLSTVLEFFGVLKDADGVLVPALTLVADDSSLLPALDGATLAALSFRSRLSIRMARCHVETVKVGSDRHMKHDLFERLHTRGKDEDKQDHHE